MIELLKKLLEEYKWIPEMLAMAAALSLLFKRFRSLIVIVFKGAWNFFSFPFKSQGYIKNILDAISALKETTDSTARDVNTLKEIIGYNGGSGLMDQVGFIIGYQTNDFWMREQPGFMCDENGRNLDCTHAYCSLLSINNRNDLTSVGWKSYADKEELHDYIIEFLDVSSRNETFRRAIRFYGANGKDAGMWLVIAQPISAKKAKTPRYMGFLYPFDSIATAIAEEKGWPLAPPI